MSPRRPLVLIGPTASGKSALAVELANRFGDTEIVSADAMAVYRGMDIGTAKPTIDERAGVVHHLIDEVDPSEDYTVARFADRVVEVIAEVEGRGRSVLVVGGTGLYVRAVVDDFTVPPRFPELRSELEADPDSAGLHARLSELDPAAAAKILPSNRRRIVRALEVCLGTGQPFSSFGPGVDHYGPTRFLLAGLDIDRPTMDARIDGRYDRQLADGFLAEVRRVRDGGLSATAAQALGYRELIAHLDGETTLDEALDAAKRRTRRFARRQQRWFRRDPRIQWFPAGDDDLVERLASWWEKPDTDP
ncbi:MAG: tRNA (adenosine(37)-N6)-dimethylallyltransferase MiaA [Actinomycetota bacterium]